MNSKFTLKNQYAKLSQGITLIETLVAASMAAVAFAGIITMSGHTFGILKKSSDLAGSTQALQERMEQIRGASWTEMVAEEPPDTGDADSGDDTYDDNDATGDPTVTLAPADETDSLPSEFADDLADLAVTTPGFAEILATPVNSTRQWNWKNLTEEAFVDSYPTSSTPIRVVATLSRGTDGTPKSTVEIKSHNKDLYYSDMVRVAITLTWTTPDGLIHRQQSQTVVSRTIQ